MKNEMMDKTQNTQPIPRVDAGNVTEETQVLKRSPGVRELPPLAAGPGSSPRRKQRKRR